MITSLHPTQDDLQEKGWNKKRSPSSPLPVLAMSLRSFWKAELVAGLIFLSLHCGWSHGRGGRFDYYGLNFWLRFSMALSMQRGMEFPLSARCECHVWMSYCPRCNDDVGKETLTLSCHEALKTFSYSIFILLMETNKSTFKYLSNTWTGFLSSLLLCAYWSAALKRVIKYKKWGEKSSNLRHNWHLICF